MGLPHGLWGAYGFADMGSPVFWLFKVRQHHRSPVPQLRSRTCSAHTADPAPGIPTSQPNAL